MRSLFVIGLVITLLPVSFFLDVIRLPWMDADRVPSCLNWSAKTIFLCVEQVFKSNKPQG